MKKHKYSSTLNNLVIYLSLITYFSLQIFVKQYVNHWSLILSGHPFPHLFLVDQSIRGKINDFVKFAYFILLCCEVL